MADTATYDKIATTTTSSSSSLITLSSIPATYTDLRLIVTNIVGNPSQPAFSMRINGDTGTNYSTTFMAGDGSNAITTATTSQNYLYGFNLGSTTIPQFWSVDFFSYAGSTYKSLLWTNSSDTNGGGGVEKGVGLWRSTAAITSVSIYYASSNTYNSGLTATLYGVKAA
jgi:hypothetical protein